MEKSIKKIFCANEQIETNHKLGLAPNGEITATCSKCGRVLKFPANLKSEEFNKLINEHKTANAGQVSIEVAQAKLKKLADK